MRCLTEQVEGSDIEVSKGLLIGQDNAAKVLEIKNQPHIFLY